MKCPHGNGIISKNIFGIILYEHLDGEGCNLLNSLDVDCVKISRAYLSTLVNLNHIKKFKNNEHLLRLAYSSYKTSAPLRLEYLKMISSQDYDTFLSGFEPVRLALCSEDDFASKGFYLMELYYLFYGISSRISAVNYDVNSSLLYMLLLSLGIRATVYESAETRAYARELLNSCPCYANSANIPVRP
ncbi:MAG: hypothetical protein ACRC3H_09740 [Lachnospiraceae bacterium]